MDIAGNDTTLSPHSFTDLPEMSKSVKYPWTYHAKNKYLGQRITVDMASAIKDLETVTGKKYIYETTIDKVDWDTEQLAIKAAKDAERASIIAVNSSLAKAGQEMLPVPDEYVVKPMPDSLKAMLNIIK